MEPPVPVRFIQLSNSLSCPPQFSLPFSPVVAAQRDRGRNRELRGWLSNAEKRVLLDRLSVALDPAFRQSPSSLQFLSPIERASAGRRVSARCSLSLDMEDSLQSTHERGINKEDPLSFWAPFRSRLIKKLRTLGIEKTTSAFVHYR